MTFDFLRRRGELAANPWDTGRHPGIPGLPQEKHKYHLAGTQKFALSGLIEQSSEGDNDVRRETIFGGSGPCHSLFSVQRIVQ
jgi:hypothetical protein